MNAKPNLGKGLSALLGDEISMLNSNADADNDLQNMQGYRKLPIALLVAQKDQPRKYFAEQPLQELAESLKNSGMLQPILVRPTNKQGQSDQRQQQEQFEIIAGERRWRAAQQAGLHEVPVIIRALDNQETLEIALIENMQRENLSPVEEAYGLKKLQENFHYTQEMLAERLGKSRPTITNALRLLQLPEKILEDIQTGAISAGHGRALVGLDDNQAIDIAEQIKDKKLSVRAVEKMLAVLKTDKIDGASQNIEISVPEPNPNIIDQQRKLQEKLGINVDIIEKNNQGKIILNFTDPVQYRHLINILLA
ncbi:MAG: ParB/RepB/Spo0J family partition protein [Alphaproteobacteria bacterium]|nr:ParB/RepB/Spo0J family partition protein [Alphaproteobacteria bacterium]